MSSLDAGLLWVEKRIRELAGELGRPVDSLQSLRLGAAAS